MSQVQALPLEGSVWPAGHGPRRQGSADQDRKAVVLQGVQGLTVVIHAADNALALDEMCLGGMRLDHPAGNLRPSFTTNSSLPTLRSRAW